MKDVEILNSNPADGATYGLTKFSDWTDEEFDALLGFQSSTPKVTPTTGLDFDPSIPEVDFTSSTTPVKDQGACGACWAFAANNNIEARANVLKPGSAVHLSEQELVDCAIPFHNGCKGGDMFIGFRYNLKHDGQRSEEDYPYVANYGKCDKTEGAKRFHTLTKYEKTGGCGTLQKTLQDGPVSTGVSVSDKKAWSQYKKGIFTHNCEIHEPSNHAVNVVGFTSEYFIVENSWGARWGLGGFIHIGINNCAGLCDDIQQPFGDDIKN